MAFRTSAKLLGVTLGVAALAGASQLGLAYGLGIVRLTRVLDLTARDQWTAELAWVAWLAMTSAVIGGMAGRPHLPTTSGAGTRLGTAVAAGLGAAIVVPLTMQPARTATVAGVQPAFVIGVCAVLGAIAGLFAAYAALSRPVARWSFLTVGIAAWAIAILSAVPSLAPGKTLPAIRLGVIDAALLPDSVTQRTALFTMPALALISGIALGWRARRRDASTLTIALTGLPGPALLTAAYLVAGPGTGDDGFQGVPYWAAMTAAGAGVLGSVLAAVLRRSPESGGPTPNRPPLTKRDPEPDSAIAQAGTGTGTGAAAGPPTPVEMPPFDGFKANPANANPAKAQGRAQPQQISPPLATPTPIAPPPQVKARRQAEPDGVAEWVSGLGNG
ncbi:hypothetical protein BJ973_006466 [Actinoplanes tereljensis]|uniref:Uncharacterized protein n=1 Tax=Paractinoplanes tereljensis TaxID=571912 RepID=A0A919NJP6_9ACTN|nr:hypothetical protein [Actinoplanes tereljensis]GIF19423.1 hypothetical protein Ate02nite_21530 [Actinoplanes tereljensis]